jgi:hypothetical protein
MPTDYRFEDLDLREEPTRDADKASIGFTGNSCVTVRCGTVECTGCCCSGSC